MSPDQADMVSYTAHRRFSLIQGPPGTGKTTTMTAIVTNWNHMSNQAPINKRFKILVCAPSNYAITLCAKKLYEIPALKRKVVRVFNRFREKWFDILESELEPFSLQYLVLKGARKNPEEAISNSNPAHPLFPRFQELFKLGLKQHSKK